MPDDLKELALIKSIQQILDARIKELLRSVGLREDKYYNWPRQITDKLRVEYDSADSKAKQEVKTTETPKTARKNRQSSHKATKGLDKG